jgi:hypothetical protein
MIISAEEARILAKRATGVPKWVWNRIRAEAMEGRTECVMTQPLLGINGATVLAEQGYTVTLEGRSTTISW